MIWQDCRNVDMIWHDMICTDWNVPLHYTTLYSGDCELAVYCLNVCACWWHWLTQLIGPWLIRNHLVRGFMAVFFSLTKLKWEVHIYLSASDLGLHSWLVCLMFLKQWVYKNCHRNALRLITLQITVMHQGIKHHTVGWVNYSYIAISYTDYWLFLDPTQKCSFEQMQYHNRCNVYLLHTCDWEYKRAQGPWR